MASPAPSSRPAVPISPTGPTSPSSSAGASSSRRRPRSSRVVLAVVLLVLGVAAVVVAAVSASWAVATAASLAVLVLGVAGVRLMQVETADVRRDWARDRADQARDYRTLAVRRTEEQAVHDATMTGRLTQRDVTITRLERRLGDATDEVRAAHQRLETEQARLAETTRRHDDLVAARERADRDHERLVARLDDAEERLAEAVGRVVELEQELDVVLAEWRAGASAPHRKHA